MADSHDLFRLQQQLYGWPDWFERDNHWKVRDATEVGFKPGDWPLRVAHEERVYQLEKFRRKANNEVIEVRYRAEEDGACLIVLNETTG